MTAVILLLAFFAADIKVAPILTRRCLACHNNLLNDGGISFENRESLLKGGPRGPAIVPGHPELSVMIRAVKRQGDLKMPPGPPLRRKEIAALEAWILGGAKL